MDIARISDDLVRIGKRLAELGYLDQPESITQQQYHGQAMAAMKQMLHKYPDVTSNERESFPVNIIRHFGDDVMGIGFGYRIDPVTSAVRISQQSVQIVGEKPIHILMEDVHQVREAEQTYHAVRHALGAIKLAKDLLGQKIKNPRFRNGDRGMRP